MTVFFFQRKPIPKKTFSIEVLFDSLRKHLPDTLQYQVVRSSFVNSGWGKKLYNTFEILFKSQGDINHITGDVHYIAIFMKKRKTILTIHDLNLLNLPSAFKRTIHRWFWLEIPIRKSQVVTVISQTTKEQILQHTHCPPEKIRVIYNCVSSAFKAHPKEFREREPIILQVGIKPNKNLGRVAEALEGISCQLEIIGKPLERDLALLEKYKINYRWEVDLTNEQVVQKYIDCDMLVFISTYEGFGLPIIEANAVGRPVVTSNISSMPEVAGDAAHLVDPFSVSSIRSGIVKVIREPSYREQLIKNGWNNCQRFMPSTIAAAYAQLYQEVFEQTR